MQARNPDAQAPVRSTSSAEALALAKQALAQVESDDAAAGEALAGQAVALAAGDAGLLDRLVTLFDGAKLPAATIAAAEAALALDGGHPGLWSKLAMARISRLDFVAADNAFQEAFRDSTPEADLLADIAALFRAGGHARIAQHWIERALDTDPAHVGVVHEQGRIRACANDLKGALEAYDGALALDPPDYVKGDIWAEKGTALVSAGLLEGGAAAFEESLRLRPQNKPVLVELAIALYRLDRRAEALKHFAAADWLDPEDPVVLSYLVHCRLLACDWAGLDASIERLQQTIDHEDRVDRYGQFMIFGLLNTSIDAARRLKVARAMAENAQAEAREIQRLHPISIAHKAAPRQRLRIGYLTASFREHSVATVFRHVMARHDHDAFEFFGYYVSHLEDEYTAEFRARFDQFRPMAHVNQTVRQIVEDRIDVLVDMEGLMAGNRLNVLAHRPAPVQAHWLGYGNSNGADYIDYLLTDQVSVPLADADQVHEKLVHLPGSFMPVALDPADPLTPRRADYGLPEDGFVFANFNEHYKFEPEVFAIWMRLLQQRPDAVLWLVEGQREAQGNLRRAAAGVGIDPDRLVFSPRVSRPRHLARVPLADLGLETLYHVGGVTTADCMVAGLPVLSVTGNNANARTGASLLSAAGVPELIAGDAAAYEAMALELTGQPERLAGYRATLQARRGPLFDLAATTRGLEAAYRAMWAVFEAGEAPRHIDVSGGTA